MQIGNASAGSSGSRFKKKPEREDWSEEHLMDKRSSKSTDLLEEAKKATVPSSSLPAMEKNVSIRKAMALKEPLPPIKKDYEALRRPKITLPIQPNKPLIPPGQVVLDKFGNFRLLSPAQRLHVERHDDMPPLPPGAPPKDSYGSK